MFKTTKKGKKRNREGLVWIIIRGQKAKSKKQKESSYLLTFNFQLRPKPAKQKRCVPIKDLKPLYIPSRPGFPITTKPPHLWKLWENAMGLVMPVTCRTHDFLIIPTKLCMGKKYFVVANLNQRELFFFLRANQRELILIRLVHSIKLISWNIM